MTAMLQKFRLIFYPLSIIVLLTATNCGGKQEQAPENEQPPLEEVAANGEALFQQYCMQCHRINRRVLGPALNGVHKRWNDEIDEMVAYVRNPPAYRNSDRKFAAYARALNEASPAADMPAQPLNEKQTKAILDYIKEASR